MERINEKRRAWATPRSPWAPTRSRRATSESGHFPAPPRLSRTAAPALPFRAILVETSTADRLRSIDTDAAALLVGDNWPAGKRGSVWRGACAACHSALAGIDDIASARAFILAAQEAGF